MIFLFFSKLKKFLEDSNRVLFKKLVCANNEAEEKKRELDKLSKQLEKIEKTRKEVNNPNV